MSFVKIILNQSMTKKQIYVAWIHISVIVNIKSEHVYKDIANDIEKRYDT